MARFSQPDKTTQNDLSRLESDNPAQAGQAILSLAINVLTPEQHSQARKSLTKCLYDQNESEYSKVAGWCRGEFTDAKRPMTPDDFQKLVNVFWHKPGGIQSVDEVLALARCIGNVKVGHQNRAQAGRYA